MGSPDKDVKELRSINNLKVIDDSQKETTYTVKSKFVVKQAFYGE